MNFYVCQHVLIWDYAMLCRDVSCFVMLCCVLQLLRDFTCFINSKAPIDKAADLVVLEQELQQAHPHLDQLVRGPTAFMLVEDQVAGAWSSKR